MVLLLLVEKKASSEPIYDMIKQLAADRKQERAVAKSKEVLRKKDDLTLPPT
ncbi:hypothetical protein SPRG_15522 [Saprolegnia parasitica CBS 223.65]|uniref:Uncharacterized protein n=1 Tax=Saprolegnia parasitica (strain CBS 223.65) TaxID=695850 RepID=A0A067BR94_SAPPC|nr:hypothetical protein SPRG_15522 [Saprolegnia parasitica CBS 223.65]KDO19320.1 hypothetical protein SPRG_15522 [Saprolegnia parasitica CBS 223.65]|eukprot:XP_012209963.1 hypothetical protein SPRG_15522 [Saprolegnia parasitica CBS 223.65]